MQDAHTAYFPNDSSARELFSADFDQKPFVFQHNLDTHPLLSMPALRELAAKVGKSETPRGYVKLPEFPQGPTMGNERVPERR